MTKSRHILLPRKYWTQLEDRTFRKIYPRKLNREIALIFHCSLNAVNSRSNVLQVHKDPDWLRAVNRANGERLRRDGVSHRFPKGNISWNKGLRRPGWFRGRMRETQFKKGQLNGHALRNHKPIGALTVVKGGYIFRKLREPGRGCVGMQCWRSEASLMWEKAHGAIPPKHRIWFRDGDKTNLRLENFELVSFAEAMRRNTIHARRSPEQKRAIYALIALKRKISKLEGKWQTTSRKSGKSCSTHSVASRRRKPRWTSTGRKQSAG